jgi:hypothetical protein
MPLLASSIACRQGANQSWERFVRFCLRRGWIIARWFDDFILVRTGRESYSEESTSDFSGFSESSDSEGAGVEDSALEKV